MKHVPFATIGEIPPHEIQNIPGLSEAISYWNEGAYPSEEWLQKVKDSWGPAGYAMRRGEEVLGFVVFGPVEFFTRAHRLAGRPSDPDAVLLADIAGDRRYKKQLLVRMLKDLRHRGVDGVEAVASDFGDPRHVSTRFLLENGWRPVRRAGHFSTSHTLMRTDLGSTVEVGELARDIIGRVKLPKLKNASPAPGGAYVRAEFTQVEFTQVEFAQVESSVNGRTAVLTLETPSGVVA